MLDGLWRIQRLHERSCERITRLGENRARRAGIERRRIRVGTFSRDEWSRRNALRTAAGTARCSAGHDRPRAGAISLSFFQSRFATDSTAARDFEQRAAIVLLNVMGFSREYAAHAMNVSPETYAAFPSEGFRQLRDHLARVGLMQAGRRFEKPPMRSVGRHLKITARNCENVCAEYCIIGIQRTLSTPTTL